MSKKNIAKSITLCDFKMYWKAIIIKRAWHWHKNWHINQWNRINSPEIHLQLIFNKDAKNTWWGRTVSSINEVGKTDYSHQKNKIGLLSHSICKNQLKIDERLKCKNWNCKTLRRKLRGKLYDIGLGNNCMDMTPEAQATQTEISKQNFTTLGSVYTA